jgi:hypothetical protein
MKIALNVRIGANRDAGPNSSDFLVARAIWCFLFWLVPKIGLPKQHELIAKMQRSINHRWLTETTIL